MAAPERFAEKSDSSCTAGTVHTWPIVLQNSKMSWLPKFASRPAKPVFDNPMPCKERTKAAGWKSD
jgi:hypothetical protein